MKKAFTNALLNPGFNFWDYGNGPFTTNGYTASRYKLAVTATPGVSVAPTTLDNTTATPKWYRGRTAMGITISTFGAGDDAVITQYIEEGERFGQQVVVMSGIAMGPAGSSFKVGIGDARFMVSTLGQDAGVDIPTHFVFSQVIDDPSTSSLPIQVFGQPSGNGTFKLVQMQVEFSDKTAEPSPFELRDYHVERMLLSRYVSPLRRGMVGVASSTSQVNFGVQFPVPMRVNPALVSVVTSNVDVNLLSSGGLATAATGTWTGSLASTTGARVSLSGFAGSLTSGAEYVLTEDGGAVFDADY